MCDIIVKKRLKGGIQMINDRSKLNKNKCRRDLICAFFTWIILCILSLFLNPNMSDFWKLIECIVLFVVLMGVTVYKYKSVLFKKYNK